jgi:hypothetical protein
LDKLPSFSKIATVSPAFGESSIVSPIGETLEKQEKDTDWRVGQHILLSI